MKKITYQITLNDGDYLECINQIEKLILFPVKGNMVFKIEEIEKLCGEEEKEEDVEEDLRAEEY